MVPERSIRLAVLTWLRIGRDLWHWRCWTAFSLSISFKLYFKSDIRTGWALWCNNISRDFSFKFIFSSRPALDASAIESECPKLHLNSSATLQCVELPVVVLFVYLCCLLLSQTAAAGVICVQGMCSFCCMSTSVNNLAKREAWNFPSTPCLQRVPPNSNEKWLF